MTLQWTFVAVFLYFEIALISLFLLPWIRPNIWQKLFKSRLVRALEAYSYIYAYALGGILLLLFFDAIREVRKYSDDSKIDYANSMHADTFHMRLFRAQRNLYVAGFALFLWLVVRRMAYLISREAHLSAAAEAAMRQAQSASDTASRLMEGDGSESSQVKNLKETVTKLKEDLKSESPQVRSLNETVTKLRDDLKKAELDRDAMKDQSLALKREYDRLAEEKLGAGSGDKKDD